MKPTRSDALSKILSESLNDYRYLTPKDLFLSLGPDEFKVYFSKVCTDSLSYFFSFDKIIPEISITRNAVEYSTLISEEEDTGVLDFDVLVSFNIKSGVITVKVVAQYDVEYIPPKNSNSFRKSMNFDKAAEKVVTTSPTERNLKVIIDNAFDIISSDKKILNIESEFRSYLEGEESGYPD